jgi:hypothetical protein
MADLRAALSLMETHLNDRAALAPVFESASRYRAPMVTGQAPGALGRPPRRGAELQFGTGCEPGA